jgi:hypothetical protein
MLILTDCWWGSPQCTLVSGGHQSLPLLDSWIFLNTFKSCHFTLAVWYSQSHYDLANVLYCPLVSHGSYTSSLWSAPDGRIRRHTDIYIARVQSISSQGEGLGNFFPFVKYGAPRSTVLNEWFMKTENAVCFRMRTCQFLMGLQPLSSVQCNKCLLFHGLLR